MALEIILELLFLQAEVMMIVGPCFQDQNPFVTKTIMLITAHYAIVKKVKYKL